MQREPICTNAAGDVVEGVHAAIATHRRKMRDLVNFTRHCDRNHRPDQSTARQMERLSQNEQVALSVVAMMDVGSADARHAKAEYLAELINADPECMGPDDLVAAFLSLA